MYVKRPISTKIFLSVHQVPLVPLPLSEGSSRASSLRVLEENQPPSNAASEEQQYRRKVQMLVENFPHLRAVATEAKDCRTVRTRSPICYDCSGEIDEQPSQVQVNSPRALRSATPGTILRLVILEDLDPRKIDFVGAAFDIAPLLFRRSPSRSGLRTHGIRINKQMEQISSSENPFLYGMVTTGFARACTAGRNGTK
jgi:hypothetical protein